MTTVLLAGGAGVVGSQVAQLLGRLYPELRLLVGGRSPDKAVSLLGSLPNAEPITMNVVDADSLASLKAIPDLVVAMVNDPDDRLLFSAVRRGSAYIDITRWTERLQQSQSRLLALTGGQSKAPVVFASSWMAATAATLARALAEGLHDAELNMDILFDMHDKAGPNSTEYMDRLRTPFTVIEQGKSTLKRPFTEPRRVTFPDHGTARTYRFDAPDQLTLPVLTGARSVSARIAFDSPSATESLKWLVRSPVWSLLNRPAFERTRHAILYNPGDGGAHRILLTAQGRDDAGQAADRQLYIRAEQGQTYLTAVGTVIQIERVLGLAGHQKASASIQFAEAETDPALARNRLLKLGIELHDKV
ncbi:saccharopine dehydrogenase [Pseudohongiella sp. SYSU M77423]|uniref:saccharopine dehydrogenase n=1 Tax=Pseudohongiella sp. SYSU M77423 TaxID=3042312 RepID=UPI002480B473|nr:saccharopine dehydrogenase [Pseudohongiella sp. SYSU M77423]MDH7942565.1 saccharopine dehydrogenase [Pseudohongiella sp. SYSU M77423]